MEKNKGETLYINLGFSKNNDFNDLHNFYAIFTPNDQLRLDLDIKNEIYTKIYGIGDYTPTDFKLQELLHQITSIDDGIIDIDKDFKTTMKFSDDSIISNYCIVYESIAFFKRGYDRCYVNSLNSGGLVIREKGTMKLVKKLYDLLGGEDCHERNNWVLTTENLSLGRMEKKYNESPYLGKSMDGNKYIYEKIQSKVAKEGIDFKAISQEYGVDFKIFGYQKSGIMRLPKLKQIANVKQKYYHRYLKIKF